MINYENIDKAVKFYDGEYDFKRIESPWTVTEEISNITKPQDVENFQLVHNDKKVLVASGEQSFLYLYNKGFLPKGQFSAVTPCFRRDSFDNTHTKYFIKHELIKTDICNVSNDVKYVVDVSYEFFKKMISYYEKDIYSLTVLQTGPDQYDINYKDIEIGSYGYRECSFLKWVYGTGIAEPRFSRALGL